MVKSPLWESSTGALVSLINSSTFVSANLYTLSFSASDEYRPQQFQRAAGDTTTTPVTLAWSAGSTEIAYTTAELELYTRRFDGAGPSLLFNTTGVEDVSYSPSGAQVAIAGVFDVFVMNTNGTGLTSIYNSSGDGVFTVDWGSNNLIAFTRGTDFQVYSITSTGGSLTQITNTPGGADSARWSPDATQLSYLAYSTADFHPSIAIISSTGGSTSILVDYSSGYVARPAWFPSTSINKLIFSANQNGDNILSGAGLWFMSSTGGNIHKFLTTFAKEPNQVVFSPDGTRISYIIPPIGESSFSGTNTIDQADCGLWSFTIPFPLALREQLLIP